MVILNLQKPFEQSFRFLAEIKAKAPKVEVLFVSPFDEETRWLWIDAIEAVRCLRIEARLASSDRKASAGAIQEIPSRRIVEGLDF